MELNKTILLNGQKHTILDKREEECEDHYGKPYIEISYLIRDDTTKVSHWMPENVVFSMTPQAYCGKAISSISQAVLNLKNSGLDMSILISRLNDIRHEIAHSINAD